MQSLRTEIGAEIRDPKGVLIRRVPFQPCHSLLKGFIQVLAAQMGHMEQTVKQYSGTVASDGPDSYALSCAGTTSTYHGIVIGSGTTPVTMEDYFVETHLSVGFGFGSNVFAVENPDSATWRLAISRGIANNTGADVDVKEVGLVGLFSHFKWICFDRTLYEVSFADGETLTLTYRISISL